MAFENTSIYPPVTMERNFKTGHDGEDAAEILANLPKFMSNLPATTPNKGLGFVDNLSLRSSSSRPSSSLSQRKKPMKFFTASILTEDAPLSPNSSPATKGSRSSRVCFKEQPQFYNEEYSSKPAKRKRKSRACVEHRRKHQRCPSYCSGRTPINDNEDSEEENAEEEEDIASDDHFATNAPADREIKSRRKLFAEEGLRDKLQVLESAPMPLPSEEQVDPHLQSMRNKFLKFEP